MYFDCTLYIFTALLAVMTHYQLRSSVMLTALVMLPVIFRIVCWKLLRAASQRNFNYHSSVDCDDWLLFHLTLMLICLNVESINIYVKFYPFG